MFKLINITERTSNTVTVSYNMGSCPFHYSATGIKFVDQVKLWYHFFEMAVMPFFCYGILLCSLLDVYFHTDLVDVTLNE